MTVTHPIPNEALDDRLGFVGTAGSGKTYGAGTAVERLLERGNRVVIPDPLGVWWGLRLNADGSPSKYDVVIFGGAHADVPITEHSGAVIGRVVANMRESAIIDLSGLGTKAAERRFMLAFLTTFYREWGGAPVHLIFDEADLWAPQQIRDREQEPAKLLGMMETICRRGRVRGFIPWLITQRPAVVNKDVLSQVDGLVAFKLTAMQDRAALGGWIEGQADKSEGRAILGKLPSMARGQAVVWLPARDILTTEQFPVKRTYDSSRTPTRGETRPTAALKPLNVEAVKALIAKAGGDAADAPGAKVVHAAPAELKAAEERGYQRGLIEGRRKVDEAVSRIIEQIEALATEARTVKVPSPEQVAAAIEATREAVPSISAAVMPQPMRPRPARVVTVAAGEIGGAARKLLTVLDTNPPVSRSWQQVAALAGLRARGGHYNSGRKELIDRGLVTQTGDRVQIARPSVDSPAPVTNPEALVSMWSAVLSGAAPKILGWLYYHGGGHASRQAVADRLGIAARGGHWNAGWKELRDNGIVEMNGDEATLTELFRPRKAA